MIQTKVIIVDLHANWPREYVRVPIDYPTHKVVEKMQRNYERMTGKRVGVTYRLAQSPDIIGAMCEGR